MMLAVSTLVLWFGAILVAAAVAIVGLLGLRKIPRGDRIGSIILRLIAIAAALGLLWSPQVESEATGQPGMLLIERGLDPAEREAAIAGAKSVNAEVIELADGAVATSGPLEGRRVGELLRRAAIRARIDSFTAPAFVEAWVRAEDVPEVQAALSGGGLPHRLQALMPAAPDGDSAVPEQPAESRPLLAIHAGASVIAGEPSEVQLSATGMPAGTRVELLLNASPVEVRRVSELLFAAELPALEAGSHELEARAALGERTIARASRSLAVVGPEEIVVLSAVQLDADRWLRLLPGFRVLGMAPDALTDVRQVATARALVVPLANAPRLNAEILDVYMRQGGLVLFTGKTEQQAREVGLPGAELAGLLPVRILEPPALPPPVEPEPPPPDPDEPPLPRKDPEPEPVVEEGEADVAKVSVVFAVDSSGSMLLANRWEHAKAAIASALKEIGSYDRIGVMLFGTQPRWVYGNGIVDVTEGSATAINDLLKLEENLPRDDAGTDIYLAVDTALTALAAERSSVRLLVVISDGEEGPNRRVDEDHRKLSSRATANETMIATIRVAVRGGSGEFEISADKVMTALATRDDLRAAVKDEEGELRVPRLSVLFVQFAYRRYEQIAEDRRKEREEREEEERRKREEEERRRAEMEEEERARLEEEERRKREEEERLRREREEEERRKREEEERRRGGLLAGSVSVSITRAGREVGLTGGLPPIGEGILAAVPLAGSRVLAEVPGGVPVLAVRRLGMGHSAWLSAPLDGASLGSWLGAPDQPAGALDVLVRRLARSRLYEMAELLELDAVPGRVTARVTDRVTEVTLRGFSRTGAVSTLSGEVVGTRIRAILPPQIERVSVMVGERELGWTSVVPVALVRLNATATAALPVIAAGAGSEPVRRLPELRKQSAPNRAWPVAMLVLVLVCAAGDRWARRVG